MNILPSWLSLRNSSFPEAKPVRARFASVTSGSLRHSTSHAITSSSRPLIWIGNSVRQRPRKPGVSASTVSWLVSTCSALASATSRAHTFTVSPKTSPSVSTTGPQVSPIFIDSLP